VFLGLWQAPLVFIVSSGKKFDAKRDCSHQVCGLS